MLASMIQDKELEGKRIIVDFNWTDRYINPNVEIFTAHLTDDYAMQAKIELKEMIEKILTQT